MPLHAQLNRTGFLLQQRVYQQLRDTRYPSQGGGITTDSLVELEVPFEYPVGEAGGIDVRLALAHVGWGSMPRAIYVIECKRPAPEASNWVFMSREEERSEEEKPAIITQSSLSMEGYENNDHLHFPALDILQSHKFPFTYQGIEFHENPEKTRVTPNVERIWNPLTQVARGTLFSVTDEKLFKRLQSPPEERRNYYLPVVVTTAKLWMTKHRYSDIDLGTGTLPAEKKQWEEVNWVAYQYPVSGLLKRNTPFDSLTIFVVNSSFLPDFINKSWAGINR